MLWHLFSPKAQWRVYIFEIITKVCQILALACASGANNSSGIYFRCDRLLLIIFFVHNSGGLGYQMTHCNAHIYIGCTIRDKSVSNLLYLIMGHPLTFAPPHTRALGWVTSEPPRQQVLTVVTVPLNFWWLSFFLFTLQSIASSGFIASVNAFFFSSNIVLPNRQNAHCTASSTMFHFSGLPITHRVDHIISTTEDFQFTPIHNGIASSVLAAQCSINKMSLGRRGLCDDHSHLIPIIYSYCTWI